MSKKDKWVRRFSVDETAQHKNGFTIYKITSVLFPLSSPEAVTIVKVWKRFSEARALHTALKPLHSALQLKGEFPQLPKARWTYYSRFKTEVIEERAKSIKGLLDFIAEHPLLFTSNQFVTFLQDGHTHTEEASKQICEESSADLLPTPVTDTGLDEQISPSTSSNNNISPEDIKIFESTDIEFREPPKKISLTDSFDSLDSLQSIDSEVFDDISKITIDNVKPSVKSRDLIDFSGPSTSNNNSLCDSVSLSSVLSVRSRSRVSEIEERSKTEDSYIFEAGYLLNLAARSEENEDFGRAFDFYKSGIEKLLIGVQNDSDPSRCLLVKKKIDKYLAYAENIHKYHFQDQTNNTVPALGSVPLSMIRGERGDLAHYRVLAALDTKGTSLLVLDTSRHYKAIKVIQKIPINITEFDTYIPQSIDTKMPILPNNIPYMVQLYGYIETQDLIFLILQYAPGEKLVDYIKKYVNTPPQSGARKVDFDNVLLEPKRVESTDLSVNELLENSQRLLMNVDSALREGCNKRCDGDVLDTEHSEERGRNVQTHPYNMSTRREMIPSSAIREWSAQLLLCLEHLHCAGVICRDLNPKNILLGDKGQIVVTYMAGYRGHEVTLALLDKHTKPGVVDMYVAPELYNNVIMVQELDKVCDFWSFGAILYELICGEPLSEYHRSVFTSHTILYLPDSLTLEEASLLSQLLTFDPSERLGSGIDGVEEIKQHPYYCSIDWQSVCDSWIIPQ